MRNSESLEDELRVFSKLCPPSIKKVLSTPDIPYAEYFKLIKMFQILGFTELSEAYAESFFPEMLEKTRKMIRIVEGEDLNLFSKDKCTPLNYTKIFVDSIKNEKLRNKFYESAFVYVNDDTEDCTNIEKFFK